MKYTITINNNDDHQAVDQFMNGLEQLLQQQWSGARLHRDDSTDGDTNET